jgi:multiple sugar transport system permease protein
VTLGTVLSSSLVGMAFARMRFRGSRGMFLVMLGTMMLPAQVTMIPLFLLFRNLGWVDTMLPLVVPAFFGSAYFIFMYRQFIAQVPEALLEAARLDGLGWLGIWWHVILPLTRPVTAITAVFTFIGCWNDFLSPLIYLQSDDQATLSVALNSFRNQFGGINKVNLLLAASLTTMIPCILLFLAAQKQFIEGLGKGAVKG